MEMPRKRAVSFAPTQRREPTRLDFRVFEGPEHSRPQLGTQYFAPTPSDEKNNRICAVVYPFFNEDRHELERSLLAVCRQAQDLKCLGVQCHVIAVMDGWYKASESMRDYVKEMFPPGDMRSDEGWWKVIEDMPRDQGRVATFVLQAVDQNGCTADVDVGGGNSLRLTMLIKLDNRRKLNSHEWFFQAYAPAVHAEFAFATDCGTLYAPKCMYHLIKYMDKNPDCAGCTGRQRVMSSAMQRAEDEGFLEMWFRAAQAFDYEASISSFQGAFALVGMLPVLPGPCGMYRMGDIRGKCLDYYFETVNIGPDQTDMVTGNLLLAEDRVLSYAASLLTGKYTSWVPHAIFYFEAETDAERFIAQRRRWTNGSFAGYVFLLFWCPGILFRSPHAWHFKLVSFVLLLLQFLMFLLVSVSPAIFISLAYYSITALSVFPGWFPSAVQALYVVLYVSYCVAHMLTKWVPFLFYAACLLNAISTVGVLTALAVSLVEGSGNVLIITSLVMGVPFLLSFMHSLECFVMMLTNFFPYIFFSPTFVAWFPAYSFARTWDLTWGNRPSDHMDSVSKENKEKTQRRLKRAGFLLCGVLMVLNVAAGYILTYLPSFRELLIVSVILAVPAIIQMGLSFVFYVIYTPHYSLAILWRFLGRSVPRAFGVALSLLTLALLVPAVLSADWLSIEGVFPNTTDTYDITYGAVRNCYSVPNVPTWGINHTDLCAAYGTDFRRWPGQLWVGIGIMVVICVMFTGVACASTVLATMAEDKSRNDSASVMAMGTTSVLLALSSLLFPLGFGTASMQRTGDTVYLFDEAPLCGPGSGFFQPGRCSVGVGYMLLVLSFLPAVAATYAFRRMQVQPAAAERMTLAVTNQIRRMSETIRRRSTTSSQRHSRTQTKTMAPLGRLTDAESTLSVQVTATNVTPSTARKSKPSIKQETVVNIGSATTPHTPSTHSKPPAKVWATFVLESDMAGPGDEIRVVGSRPELGMWNPGLGVSMDSMGTRHEACVELPANCMLEYKFVRVGEDGDVLWMDGQNIRFAVGDMTFGVFHSW